MEITEVHVKTADVSNHHLVGFCSVTLDNVFVVHDIKIIDGSKGLFIAMPSRRLMDRCQKCLHKNALQAMFCNQCGSLLGDRKAFIQNEREVFHMDVCHPICSGFRGELQQRVLEQYNLAVGSTGETIKKLRAQNVDRR